MTDMQTKQQSPVSNPWKTGVIATGIALAVLTAAGLTFAALGNREATTPDTAATDTAAAAGAVAAPQVAAAPTAPAAPAPAAPAPAPVAPENCNAYLAGAQRDYRTSGQGRRGRCTHRCRHRCRGWRHRRRRQGRGQGRRDRGGGRRGRRYRSRRDPGQPAHRRGRARPPGLSGQERGLSLIIGPCPPRPAQRARGGLSPRTRRYALPTTAGSCRPARVRGPPRR